MAAMFVEQLCHFVEKFFMEWTAIYGVASGQKTPAAKLKSFNTLMALAQLSAMKRDHVLNLLGDMSAGIKETDELVHDLWARISSLESALSEKEAVASALAQRVRLQEEQLARQHQQLQWAQWQQRSQLEAQRQQQEEQREMQARLAELKRQVAEIAPLRFRAEAAESEVGPLRCRVSALTRRAEAAEAAAGTLRRQAAALECRLERVAEKAAEEVCDLTRECKRVAAERTGLADLLRELRRPDVSPELVAEHVPAAMERIARLHGERSAAQEARRQAEEAREADRLQHQELRDKWTAHVVSRLQVKLLAEREEELARIKVQRLVAAGRVRVVV